MASLLCSDLNIGKEIRKSNEWLFATCFWIFLYKEKKIGGECWDEISSEFNFLMSANILTFTKSFQRRLLGFEVIHRWFRSVPLKLCHTILDTWLFGGRCKRFKLNAWMLLQKSLRSPFSTASSTTWCQCFMCFSELTCSFLHFNSTSYLQQVVSLSHC